MGGDRRSDADPALHFGREKERSIMRKLTLFAAAVLAAVSTPALATVAPTLHGFCALGSVCVDNGTNTPTGVNPPVFAFASSGQNATGNLTIDVLIPNNITGTGPYTITGALSGTATLFSPTAWTSGQLDSFLGITASPTNPIGAYLPATQGFQPTATGFYVFQANLGLATLLGTSGIGGPTQDTFLMQLGQVVPQGSYIVGFFSQTGSTTGATANSGAILVTGSPPPPPPPPGVPEPATWAMMLAGFGVTGFALRRTRRRKALLTQIA